tara:strand:+ start:332 stop:1183 length:852 start_codon:yes stop_codon:yes gene_type:complete
MESFNNPKMIALLAMGIIILSFIIYYIIGYLIKSASNKMKNVYSKSRDLCYMLSNCDEHTIKNDNIASKTYMLDVKDSEKRCANTSTNIKHRKDLQCQYDNIDNSSKCYDCTDEQIKNNKCKIHNMNADDSIPMKLPNINECFNAMGINGNINKSILENKYSLKIKDKGSDSKNKDKYNGLDNNWWDKNDHLYKCLTGHNEYLFNPKKSDGEPGGWDTDSYSGFSRVSYKRFLSCGICFDKYGKNVKDYKNCMKKLGICHEDEDSAECSSEFYNLYEEEVIGN